MSDRREIVEDTTEDFFENAPCGFLSKRADGTIVKVNRTFESLIGSSRDELVGRRFQELLSPGGRIYHETHYAPLLQMQGWVREIAVEIVRADGSRLPALINSVLRRDADGRPAVIRTSVFDATDRRRYEEELRLARRREHEVAHELQRSMLAGALPSFPGLTLDVAYRPAVSTLEVGGDWYDAFWLEPGETVGLVVGDVVGRGIEAAATMGQLRSALRALASTGLAPAGALRALDAYSKRHDVGRVATLVYAQLGVESRRLRFASAGHLPPAILTPGEAPFLAWDGRTAPLDAYYGRPIEREQAELELPPGSRVLLYTDGIIESRSRALDDGLDRLLAELSSDPDVTPEALAHTLRDPEEADDLCVLAAGIGR